MGGAPWWLTTVGWFVTVLGWFITSYQANQREVRKERRAEVDACCKMAADLLDKARKFYALPGDSAEAKVLAADIRFLLQRLLTRAERLQTLDSAFDVVSAGAALMESLTGADFDSISRPAWGPNEMRMQAIEADTHAAMDALEAGFSAMCRRRWWRWRIGRESTRITRLPRH